MKTNYALRRLNREIKNTDDYNQLSTRAVEYISDYWMKNLQSKPVDQKYCYTWCMAWRELRNTIGGDNKMTKERVYNRIKEMGFNTDDFNQDYENCLDNYSQEYEVENPEDHSDFENYCVDNWTPETIEHIENREKAIKLLGNYAYHQKTGKVLDGRVEQLVFFMDENPGEKIEIEINNNWSYPPKYSTVKKSKKLGGTTYKYMVWAVIR